MSAEERAALIAVVEGFPEQLAGLVSGLSPEDLTTPYLAGEWTVAQNVHHLVDSHINAYIRCKLIVTEENPPLKPYRQDDWAALPDASDGAIAVSLTILHGLHARWARFWRELPVEAWERSGLHPDNGPMSLDRLLRVYAGHGEAHIDQITRTLAAKP